MGDRQEQDVGRLAALAGATATRVKHGLRRALRPAVRRYRAYRELRPEFWIAESGPRPDGRRIEILCAASDVDRRYVLRQTLGELYRERSIGRASLRDVPGFAARKAGRCCVAIVRAEPRTRGCLGGGRTWITIPNWVVGEVDIPLPPRILASNNARSDLRRIRKNGLRPEVSRDLCDFEEFYFRMHVPYVRRTFGDGAVVRSHDALEARFRAGEILWVVQGGTRIAGVLIEYVRGVPRLLCIGVRDGDREHVDRGAIAAADYFAFEHLAARGFSKAWLGRSRAFLHDGILMYKKKFGMRIAGASDGFFCLAVLRDGDDAKAFLRDNPFIFEQDGLLHGAVFAEAGMPGFSGGDFGRVDRRFFMEGLSRIFLVRLAPSGSPPVPPPELAERIAVRSAAELLDLGCVGPS